MNDSELLSGLSNIGYSEILFDKNDMYKRVLTENYIACQLYPYSKELHFYMFDKYDVDFLIKEDGNIIPVEVKSERRTNSKSLNEYIKKYCSIHSIRISSNNFGYKNNIRSVFL